MGLGGEISSLNGCYGYVGGLSRTGQREILADRHFYLHTIEYVKYNKSIDKMPSAYILKIES